MISFISLHPSAMSKVIVILCFFILLACHSFGQNLVPNPSFEDSICFTSFPFTNFNAAYWFNPSNSTPDYLGVVSGGEFCGLNNVNQGEYPAWPRTGERMIGLWGMQLNSEVREFVQVELTSALIQDSSYCVEMYVKLVPYSQIAIDRIGALFTTDSLLIYPQSGVLGPSPQVTTLPGQYISDSSEWTELIWTFIAQGGERFMTIGNHYQNAEVQYITVDSNQPVDVAYYYYDDISVYLCNAVGLQESDLTFSISPNPITDHIILSAPFDLQRVMLFDVLGRVILSRQFFSGVIDTSTIPSGIYFLVIEHNGIVESRKLVLERN